MSDLRLPEPLETVYRSILATDPTSTVDEARQVLQLVASRHHPKSVSYYTAIARNGGFGGYLQEIRRSGQGRKQP